MDRTLPDLLDWERTQFSATYPGLDAINRRHAFVCNRRAVTAGYLLQCLTNENDDGAVFTLARRTGQEAIHGEKVMRPTEQMMRQDETPDTAAQVAMAREKSDPAARALLELTHARMYAWPQHFPGYRATLQVNDNGQEVRGEVAVSATGEVHVQLSDNTALRDWVQERLWLQAMHLLYRPFELGDGRYVVTFGETPAQHGRHPRGVQVVLQGGRLASWYRIADHCYTQISRTLQGQHRHINTLERYETAPDGRLYATHYVMVHFNDPEAQLTGIESYVNTFCEVSGYSLPSRRTIAMSADGAVRTREIILEAHRLLT